ncbi:hypothetical protein ACWIUD_00635 [Helicobacter sp. 23-1044]
MTIYVDGCFARIYDYAKAITKKHARFCDSRKISQNLGAESITAVLEFFP